MLQVFVEPRCCVGAQKCMNRFFQNSFLLIQRSFVLKLDLICFVFYLKKNCIYDVLVTFPALCLLCGSVEGPASAFLCGYDVPQNSLGVCGLSRKR